ncbi:MAG: magnesium chelatase subunit H, partial [Chitinispirillaceae bacterium]
HARNWTRIMSYWSHSGPENICNLLALVLREYCGVRVPQPSKPKVYPPFGIFDPLTGRTFTNILEYRKTVSGEIEKPFVGILFYGGMHFSQSLVPAKSYVKHLKDMGFGYIPVFSSALNNLQAIETFFLDGGKPIVDAVVYIQWFQLTTFSESKQADTIELLKRLNVPVFCSCPMFGRGIDKWRMSTQGLSPVEILTTVILPEVDGMIEPLPSCGLVEIESSAIEGKVMQVRAIDENIEFACRRIKRWLDLRKKANADKRIAFVVYNNPPGEDSLGNAAYLDTFKSMELIFSEMAEVGYRVSDLPASSLHEHLLSNHLLNDPRWGAPEGSLKHAPSLDKQEYMRLANTPVLTSEVADTWGTPPGSTMTVDGQMVLPIAQFGNICLAVQPSRGFHADPDKLTHDKTLPPHHQYVAFYRWLEKTWQADCIVHVGTHGTLEFLKGKEAGMSTSCFPALLIGTVPHLYLYHIVNASEAIIAKRRSLGTLVNYNSPSFMTGGLYDAFATLEELIGEYYEATSLQPQRAQRLEKRVVEEAARLNLNADSIVEIQEEVGLMKRSIVPKGLHTIGVDPDDDARITFAVFYLRTDRADHPSLHRLLAKRHGLTYESLLEPSKASVQLPSDISLETIEREVTEIVTKAWHNGIFPDDIEQSHAVKTAITIAKRLSNGNELKALLEGLEGTYIEPGIGGDPLRNPDVLPTGRNSFQFDPRLVPSDEAIRRGAQIAENTLAHYYRIHGTWPNSTAVILWGFETTKTRGETVGQVLAYIGVRIKAGSNPYYKQLEIITPEELGRPRVDCMVQICGFFRDMFPNVMDLMDRAFAMVSGLDESADVNPIRTNTAKIEQQLAGQVTEETLKKIANGRIFGPRAGEYGTRTTTLIESGAWKNEEEIVDLFTSSMGHLYSGNLHGERNIDAYQARLDKVDVVSQVRDSHEYEIMDLDHYYEFFGGLSRTVESVRGSAPEMLISDTTKELIRTETVKESFNRGIRTRLLNPKWIDELLKHEYHGAQKISDRVEYLIGFSATTHAVDNWVYSAVTDRYVRDETMFKRMTNNNRFATEEVIKRLSEADRRGYWKATDEQRSLLKQRYLQLEGDIEERL